LVKLCVKELQHPSYAKLGAPVRKYPACSGGVIPLLGDSDVDRFFLTARGVIPVLGVFGVDRFFTSGEGGSASWGERV
jgi:hypothetical protein